MKDGATLLGEALILEQETFYPPGFPTADPSLFGREGLFGATLRLERR